MRKLSVLILVIMLSACSNQYNYTDDHATLEKNGCQFCNAENILLLKAQSDDFKHLLRKKREQELIRSLLRLKLAMDIVSHIHGDRSHAI